MRHGGRRPPRSRERMGVPFFVAHGCQGCKMWLFVPPSMAFRLAEGHGWFCERWSFARQTMASRKVGRPSGGAVCRRPARQGTKKGEAFPLLLPCKDTLFSQDFQMCCHLSGQAAAWREPPFTPFAAAPRVRARRCAAWRGPRGRRAAGCAGPGSRGDGCRPPRRRGASS